MTWPAGQSAAAGEPAMDTVDPAAFFELVPASGRPQVQVPLPTPLCQASASPPDVVAAKNSVWPDPLTAAAGTPARSTGPPASGLHRPQDTPFQVITAADPAVVRQKTSTS